MDTQLAAAIENHYTTSLSKREKEVLELVAEGLSTKAIARVLFVSENTIETHRRNIIRKLGTKNMPGALSVAYKKGMI